MWRTRPKRTLGHRVSQRIVGRRWNSVNDSQVGWHAIRKRSPRNSWLNGVDREQLQGTSCRSGSPAASMTWTRQHGSPDTRGIRNRESRTPPPSERRGFGRRPVERAGDDLGGSAAPRLSESAFSHPHGPARISRAGLFSCATSSKDRRSNHCRGRRCQRRLGCWQHPPRGAVIGAPVLSTCPKITPCSEQRQPAA